MPEVAISKFLHPQRPKPGAPLLIYLPGMDGTGQLLQTQIPDLEHFFDIRRLSIPVDDLTDWDDIVSHIAELIREELKAEPPRRIVYLCGESFGGCLALKLAIAAPELCDRMILINPASSFKQTWIRWITYFSKLFPDHLYPLSCIALLPFLVALDRVSAPQRNLLLSVMQSVQFRSAMWRIFLLGKFEVMPTQLQQLTQPTLVISSGNDRLLPSVAEGRFLTQQMPHALLYIIPQGGHAVLLEQDVNLYNILSEKDFLVSVTESSLLK